MADTMSTPDGGTDTDPLWLATGAGMVGVAAWTHRGRAWEAGLPYGLTAGRPSPWHPDPLDPRYEVVRQLPPYHVTTAGWIGAGIAAATVVGVLACVAAALSWLRWRRGGGTAAIPRIPVWAASAAAGGITWAAALVLSRQPVAATVAAVVVAAALLVVGRPRAEAYRATRAFSGLAEQVLGHGHPGIARVQASGWQHRGGRSWPTTITASTGPGWRHMPAELAELDRMTQAMGWPTYTWTRDLMRRRIVGTAPDE